MEKPSNFVRKPENSLVPVSVKSHVPAHAAESPLQKQDFPQKQNRSCVPNLKQICVANTRKNVFIQNERLSTTRIYYIRPTAHSFLKACDAKDILNEYLEQFAD